MDLTPEQLLAAHKANVEALAGMTRQAFSGMEQLIELNLSLTKTLLAEAHQLSLDSMSVKDTQELLTLQTGLLAPMTHKILSYQNELTQMAQSLGSNFGLQAQSQLEQGQAQIHQWMSGVVPAASGESQPMFNAFKTAVETGAKAMENVQKAILGASRLLENPLEPQVSQTDPVTAHKPSANAKKSRAKSPRR